MQKFGSSWRVSTYITDDLAHKFEEERQKTELSESKFLAAILNGFLFPYSIK